MVEKALEKGGPIFSLGPVIHNRQVVEALEKKGLEVIGAPREAKGGMLVVSSHGISPKTLRDITRRGFKVIDTTCPFVRKAQEIARDLSEAGYKVIIVGDAGHPEVKALVDFVSGVAMVIKDAREASRLRVANDAKLAVISQTTQSTKNFLGAVAAIAAKRPGELRVFNTICRDAETRQAAASALTAEVGAMLVVGGRNSANTRRLFEVCKDISRNTHLVETEGEVRRIWFDGVSRIGVTSGASTPEWVISKVVAKVNSKLKAQSVKLRRKV
jgi:4-hydroxy-3-methylbut-2-enyl diphosphate reductase